MRRLQGSTSDFGLIFDWKNWDYFYYLVVDPGDQWFDVARVVGGVSSIVIPRTDSTSILPGNAINRLRIDRAEAEIAISINGKQLATANDAGFSGSAGVGLYMESDAVAAAAIRYDDIEVWQLDSGQLRVSEIDITSAPLASNVDLDSALN